MCWGFWKHMIRGQSGACFRVRVTGFDRSYLCWARLPEATRKCTKPSRQLSTNIQMFAREVTVVKVMQTSDPCLVSSLFPFSIFVVLLPARLIPQYDAVFQHRRYPARQHKDTVPFPVDSQPFPHLQLPTQRVFLSSMTLRCYHLGPSQDACWVV